MKKTKFIALVLIAAIMLMGAGYAWWSDTITVNNTVTTGELKVEFVNDWKQGGTWGDDREESYLKTPYFFETGKTVMSAQLNDLYPMDSGTMAVVSVKIVNNGTLAAKFEDAVVKPNASKDLKDKMNVQVFLADEGYQPLEGRAYKVTGTLGTMEQAIEELLNGFEIEPGETYMFRMTYQLDETAGNSLENKTASPKIELKWTQFNKN